MISQEQFEQFFTEIRLNIGEKRTLADLLIKPVQRIQKYQLLMRDILKYTERAGDSLDKLRKGFEVMCIVPKACDDMMQVGRLQNFDGNLNAQGKLLFQVCNFYIKIYKKINLFFRDYYKLANLVHHNHSKEKKELYFYLNNQRLLQIAFQKEMNLAVQHTFLKIKSWFVLKLNFRILHVFFLGE